MKLLSGKHVAGQSSLGVFFGLPWCCILPAVLSLVGLAAGLGAIRFWSIKLIPLFFGFSLLFILRAHWLIYARKQGTRTSIAITWISTIFAGFFWSARFGIIPVGHLLIN